jgi:type IV pilus assembly protein PilB
VGREGNGIVMELRRKKLGTIMVALGVIDPDQEKAALEYGQTWGYPFGMACVKMGFVDENTVVQTLAVQMGAPSMSLGGVEVPMDVLALLPGKYAEKHRAVPVTVLPPTGFSKKGTLVVAVSTPKDLAAMDELAFITGHKISAVVTSDTDMNSALLRFYGVDVDRHSTAAQMVEPHDFIDPSEEPSLEHKAASEPLELENVFIPNSRR